MSETAKKEWNVGDAVWIAMRNPEARTDYVVYQGTVERKWTPEKHFDKVYYCVRMSNGKSVWWVSCPYETEREAVEYALQQSVEVLAEWTTIVKKFTDRLNALTAASVNGGKE